jgi:hypothetical protein
MSAHNYKTTGLIAEIQTVQESAHRGEGYWEDQPNHNLVESKLTIGDH